MEDGVDGWHELSGLSITQLLRQTLASSHDPVLIVERESRRVLACNGAFEQVFGYPSKTVCGQTTEFLYPDRETYLRVGELSRRDMLEGQTARGECLMRTADGRTLSTFHAVSPITDESGRIVAAVSVIQDRTPWRNAEKQIAESHQRLATVFANLPGAIARFALDERRNPRLTHIEGPLAFSLLGGDEADHCHERFFRCLDGGASSSLQQSLAHSAVSGRPLDLSLRATALADERTYWLRLVSHPHRDPVSGEWIWEALLLDVTREKAAEENVRHLANHDPVTNLPNRLLFRHVLESRLRERQSADPLVAVVALNLDRFRYVNNALGIGAGDQLLVEVARRLESVLEPAGTVSRTGSDDFMVMVTRDTAPDGLQPLLRRLSHQLRTPFVVGQEVLYLSCCLGVSRHPADAADAEGLMVCADTALQRARSLGPGNVTFYHADMTDSVVATATLESDLHHAIKHRQIEVHFQPKVDPVSFEVLGLEGLARWQHPARGAISPAEFIPLAEETGLIHAIGEQVLYTACAQLMDWAERGIFAGPVSINLSGRELTDATSHQVQSILHETGLPADRLELEITESALVTDTHQAQRMLAALTDTGIRIALDDFGKGYSSLSYLRRFPINTLKIDRSFVQRIDASASQRDLVGAIVSMARSLNMRVVAEGVETRAQLEALRAQSVDAIQGWYFSPALSVEDIEPLLARGAIRPTGTAS
ncbi:EAL domain-containing protein [Ectothiorhodospiraceae bacterium WFHF3C12]|nr:EAL domain-containing protein [Ectothiorhodospiraceae bacterium WFHF3C12]